jgi:hypothetical protein
MIAVIVRSIKEGRKKEKVSDPIEPAIHKNSEKEIKISPIEKPEKKLDDPSELIIEANKKAVYKFKPNNGEKYYSPEDTIKESSITKEVEAFNREVKVQNKSDNKKRQ